MFETKTAVFAVFLLSVSSYHIQISQFVRVYSLGVLFCLIAGFSFWNLIEKNNRKYSLMYLLSALLFLNTHYYAAFVVFAFFIYGLTQKSRLSFLSHLVLGILYSPNLYFLSRQIGSTYKVVWRSQIDLASILNLFYHFSSASLFLLVLFISSLLFLLLKSKGDKQKPLLFLSLWLIVPMLLSVICSVLFEPVFHVRYFIFILPAFLGLVAFAVSQAPKKILLGLYSLCVVLGLYSAFSLIDSGDKSASLRDIKKHIAYSSADLMLHMTKCSYAVASVVFDEPQFLTSSAALSPSIRCLLPEGGVLTEKEISVYKRIWLFDEACVPEGRLSAPELKDFELKSEIPYAGNARASLFEKEMDTDG